jgi:hypothetical protein
MSDPAIVGYCRVGYFRIGVYDPVFDRMLRRLESRRDIAGVTPPTDPSGLPAAVWDQTDWDKCLWQ